MSSKKLKRQGKSRDKSSFADIIKRENEQAREEYPSVSYRYMTTNKGYNFGHFNAKEARRLAETAANVYKRTEEITKSSWRHWGALEKSVGLEAIDFASIKFEPYGIELAGDENIYIFRVKGGKQSGETRILGFRKDNDPTYYVIGYDFDFSAYDHGN